MASFHQREAGSGPASWLGRLCPSARLCADLHLHRTVRDTSQVHRPPGWRASRLTSTCPLGPPASFTPRPPVSLTRSSFYNFCLPTPNREKHCSSEVNQPRPNRNPGWQTGFEHIEMKRLWAAQNMARLLYTCCILLFRSGNFEHLHHQTILLHAIRSRATAVEQSH